MLPILVPLQRRINHTGKYVRMKRQEQTRSEKTAKSDSVFSRLVVYRLFQKNVSYSSRERNRSVRKGKKICLRSFVSCTGCFKFWWSVLFFSKCECKSNKICFCILISCTGCFKFWWSVLFFSTCKWKSNKICFYPFISCIGCFKNRYQILMKCFLFF